MSNADAYKDHFPEDLKRIFLQAQKIDSALPYLLKKSIGKVDIVRWLAGINTDTKCYWKGREGQIEFGGVGSAYSIAGGADRPVLAGAVELFNCQPDVNPVLFSARNFSDETRGGDQWHDFPDRMCLMPERMIIRRDNDYTAVGCIKVSPESDLGDLTTEVERFNKSRFSIESPVEEFNTGFPVSINQLPDYDCWKQNVEKSLLAISSGHIEKVVMARRTDFAFEKSMDPLSLLASLKHANPGCFAILYQPNPGAAFISLTPERLYRRTGRRLEVDAMSSTMPRGATPQEDRQMAHELLSDDKLRREQQHVIDGNIASITPLIEGEAISGETSVIKLERIQHLLTPIEGNLSEGVSDDDIIDALHPTPAVGGTPRDKAVDMIYNLEGFERGWYASPIGYISDRQSEFAVGIRSMLVRGKTISVFTGAGIVAGSDPETEWREINSKDILRPILNGVTVR